MKYTQNYNLKKPEGTDSVNIDDLNYNADVLDEELAKRIINAGNVPSIQAGLDASKPAPGTVGRLYVATDTQILYRDTGTAWQKVGVVKWGDIEGKPSSFTPSAHKSTHAIGGSDALSPADIGAETPSGAQAKVEAHASAQASLTTLGHVKHAVLTATLDTTWSGTSSPYTKTVTVNGILASDTPIVDVVMSGTYATDEARIEQWGYVYRITTGDNSITAYATDKPTVELPIQIKVVR